MRCTFIWRGVYIYALFLSLSLTHSLFVSVALSRKLRHAEFAGAQLHTRLFVKQTFIKCHYYIYYNALLECIYPPKISQKTAKYVNCGAHNALAGWRAHTPHTNIGERAAGWKALRIAHTEKIAKKNNVIENIITWSIKRLEKKKKKRKKEHNASTYLILSHISGSEYKERPPCMHSDTTPVRMGIEQQRQTMEQWKGKGSACVCAQRQLDRKRDGKK